MHGFGDLNAYVRTLTDKPVTVVNTHGHRDHVGGNFHFDSCYIPVRDISTFQGYIGFPKEQLLELAKNIAKDEYKDLLVPDENFVGTHPMRVYTVSDGDIFDLGGRKLEVVDCGGHEIFDSSIIDEGIVTAAKVIAGTDAKVKETGMTGKDICYAYKKNDDGTNEGGHRFNMSYDPERVIGG